MPWGSHFVLLGPTISWFRNWFGGWRVRRTSSEGEYGENWGCYLAYRAYFEGRVPLRAATWLDPKP